MTLIPGLRGAVCLLWLLLAGVGFSYVLQYQNNPGASAYNTTVWPEGSEIQLDATRPTLLLFAHPQCPCTRATIEELNRLLANSDGKANVQVWFYQPREFSADWSHSDLWNTVAAIKGIEVKEDIDGNQAKLFGAETSGTVFLYSHEHRLLFKGGITGSRGHAGENPGEHAVASILSNKEVQWLAPPVYGCSLLGCDKVSTP